MSYLSNKLLITIGIILSTFGIIFLTAGQSAAVPRIAWTPDKVTHDILAGESTTISVSFTTSENIAGADVRVVPELAPFVQTNPTSFENIVAGQTMNLDVSITIPDNTPPQTIDGTIQLRNAGRPPRTFARPLPVTIEVFRPSFSNDQLGLTIEYPPTWTIRPGGRTTVFSNVSEPSEVSETSLQEESFFEIRLHDEKNPGALPINQWFEQFFNEGFAVEPLSKDIVTIGGRDAVRIETSEIGPRVHIYVPNQTDIIEIVFGLFSDQFIDGYERMLNSLRFTQ